jgi:hypothetical protein
MKKLLLYPLLSFLFLLLYRTDALAQYSYIDTAAFPSSPDSVAFATVLTQYHKTLFPENGLFNGGEYVNYEGTLAGGYPYYGPDRTETGWVYYNGIRYDHLKLLYDVVLDVVAIRSPNDGFSIALQSERLRAFSMEGHLFVRVVKDSVNDVRTGFYEILYQGKVQLMRRSTKNIQEYTNNLKVERFVYSDSSYYLVRGDHFFAVNHKKSLLSAMADHRKPVQTYMRKNKLKIGKEKDDTLEKIVAYYDGLTP